MSMVDEKLDFIGISAYPGVIYARSKKLKSTNFSILTKKTDISYEDRKIEESSFIACIAHTEEEIQSIIDNHIKSEGGKYLVEILTTQKEMLHDPLFRDGVVNRIRNLGENAPLAIENTIQRIYEEFLDLKNEFFRERADLIQDIGKRVSQNLANPGGKKSNISLNYPCILIAKDISPSELLAFNKSMILGIATDHGGKTGHMAIIARNYGIPTIVGLKNLSTYIEDGEYLLLDADRGFIKRNPSWEEYKFYGIRSAIPNYQSPTISTNSESRSLDGIKVDLKVNLELHTDCKDILLKNPAGIGLYRSEVLFMQFQDHTPTEEEQFIIYKNILQTMGQLPVVIRVFDIGADKFEVGVHEENPFLGNRGIRYLLNHPVLFKEQLRALLRASHYGNLQILIPMVNTRSEILAAIQILNECKKELILEGIHFNEKIPLGIMVETPVCALGLEHYLPYVDFISIGTNDLLQYIMAVERNNFSVSDLYNPYHFVFLDLMEKIVKLANKKKIPVSICGEIATDPQMTGILLAMGYRDLSVSPPFIHEIRERISLMKISKQKSLLKNIRALAYDEKYYEIDHLTKSDIENNHRP